MKNKRNQRCPKCGKKNKACQCKKRNWKLICMVAFSLILLSSCSLFWYAQGKNNPVSKEVLIANAKKRFNQALLSLPDKKVQEHLLALTKKDGFVQYDTYPVPNQILFNKDKQFLAVNAATNWWIISPIEIIWGNLVHENEHLLQFENSKALPDLFRTEKQESEFIWNCEIDAMMAETKFAQNRGFFAQNYQVFAQKMEEENMDMRTAIIVIAYPILMSQRIYRQYWPYFPEIYNSQLPPRYRAKYGAHMVN